MRAVVFVTAETRQVSAEGALRSHLQAPRIKTVNRTFLKKYMKIREEFNVLTTESNKMASREIGDEKRCLLWTVVPCSLVKSLQISQGNYLIMEEAISRGNLKSHLVMKCRVNS